MEMPHFEWTISVGNLIEMIVLVGTVFQAYNKIIMRISRLSTYVTLLWNEKHPDNQIKPEHI
jgi:hypothetical protein